MLRIGLERVALNEIVSFTAAAKERSWAVMQRVGMRRDEDFDYPAFPEGHSLRRHCLFRLDAQQWMRQKG